MGAKEPWKRVASELRASAAPGGRARHGTCWVEGTRVVERALRSGARLERAAVDAAFLASAEARTAELRAGLMEHGCELVETPAAAFAELTGGRALGGVVALARLPAAPTLEEVVGRAAEPARLAACVAFQDPGNVGAVVRTAHATGIGAVLVVGSTDAFHPKAIRTSMGSLFRMPIVAFESVGEMTARLRALAVPSVGAVTAGGVPVTALGSERGATCAVLGSEAFGLSADEADALDVRVTIPMPDGVDSLSVNAAAAILFHELRRGTLTGAPYST